MRSALLAALVLYALTTGWGVLNDGFHSDDWRHLHGASPLWTRVEGRWVLEVIFRHLLGEHFLLPVQLALAFACFWWVAGVIARHAAPAAAQPAARFAVFAVAVNHIFMADALSFASNVFAYPLALALSVAAFEIIWRSEGRAWTLQAAAAVAAAQLLALSLGIYQTFAVAGLILPVLALVRIDKVAFGGAVRLAAIGAVASMLAIVLYLMEWRVYAALNGVAIVSERFSATDAEGLALKLRALPALVRSLHTGTIMQLPFALRATMGLFSLATLALLALGWAAQAQAGPSARLLAAARVATGAGLALFAFPVLFWLGYEGDIAPARAFAYLGFWIAALFVAGLALAAGRSPWRHVVTGAGMAGILAVAIVHALTASAFWSDSARVGARDTELARLIRARLGTLPGYTGSHVRLVGGVDYPDLTWGSVAGWSTFHAGNPNMGIFRGLFGDAVDTVSVPASPRACPAYPAPDAAFMHEGTAYLCLTAMPAVTEGLTCAPLPDGGDFCLGPGLFAHVARTCLPTGPDAAEMRVAFRYPGQSHAPERSFTVSSFAVPLDGLCYTVALQPGRKGLQAVDVRLIVPGGGGWEQTYEVGALRPRAPS